MPQWDAGLYLKFATERTQPSADLIHRVALEAPRRIIDLGCGPGNSTEVLRQRWPRARVIGLDSSPDMVEAARAAYPEGIWVVGDAASWQTAEPFDLLFANSLLQWIPDQANLCRRLFEQVAPGGALAVQVPARAHYETPIHSEILAISEDPAWRHRMHAARATFHFADASLYYDTLRSPASRIDLWETTYYHVVAGPKALLEWYRGTGLRPFLEPLAAHERARFEQMALERYAAAYPCRTGGEVLFPFHRLFFVAYR